MVYNSPFEGFKRCVYVYLSTKVLALFWSDLAFLWSSSKFVSELIFEDYNEIFK